MKKIFSWKFDDVLSDFRVTYFNKWPTTYYFQKNCTFKQSVEFFH